MALDPSIPLQVQRPRFVGPADLISLRNLRTQAESGELALAEARRKREQEIALRDLLREPGAIDEATGEISGSGLAGISRMDPLLGLKLRHEQRVALSDLRKAQRESMEFESKMSDTRSKLSKEVRERAVAAADLAKASGGAADVIDQAYRQAWQDAIDEQERNGSLSAAGVSADLITQARTNIMPLERARALVLSPEHALEAAQYAPEGPPPANVPLSQVGQPPQGIVQPEGATTFPAETAVPQPQGIPDTEAEPRVVTAARPIETPDDLRRRAQALEAKGGKVNFERAKDLRARATAEEGRILEEARLEESRKAREETAKGREQTQAHKLIEVENKLRDDFTKASKVFVDTRDAYTRIRESAAEPSAAGDLALIFNYMKLLDPGSVVREGEFATAQSTAGVPDQVRNMYNRLLRGGRLNERQRDDFVKRARMLYSSMERNQTSLEKQYRDIAKRANVDPEDVIVNFRPAERPKQPPTAPAAKPKAGYGQSGKWTQSDEERLQELERKRNAAQ